MSPDADRETLERTTRYDPAEVEDRISAAWFEAGAFRPDLEAAERGEEGFAIAIPPPNVTGVLHMGHALNGSIQDTLTRVNRMRGRPTCWALGTDHAGIATQSVVEKQLRSEGISRHDLGREEFEKRVWAWREDYGSRIVEQYKRLGASCDYDDVRFTLDDRYVEAVMKVFVSLHERGYVYRDNYMVNWDPGTRSAISDLEVEMREVTDALYEIDYPIEGSDDVLTVATVRPETMLGDSAVAVNPDDERYRHLVGSRCLLPLTDRRIPIIADAHVDVEFGTGALKITPGHDPNDFEIGRAHGLEEISVIGEAGRMTSAAGERFEGLEAEEARDAVVEALREAGALRSEEPYTHSVPFSERSGARIEPLISLQWFCRMDELAAPAIEVVERDEVRIVPDNYKRVYLDWMRNIRPWCVSRQLWWGHRLPVWYCEDCDEVHVAIPGSEPSECDCGGGLRREEDVLDTWFSSALWPFAVLGWPEDTDKLRVFYPTSFLTTAREIIFLWVARMVMMGLEFAGDVPFRDVYVHPVVQAPDGRRMSKSLGTGIDPLTEIDANGADALRFGLLAMSSTQDVRFSADRVRQGRDLANKIWNASRLILLNANLDAVAGGDIAPSEHVADRWIVSRTERAVGRVSDLIDAYDFAHAALELYDFFWSELCDWYLEIVKPRLYDGDPDATRTLVRVLDRTLALAHPMMPFVTEEVYGHLRPFLGEESAELLATHPFPHPEAARVDTSAEAEIGAAIDSVRAVRRWRDLVGLAPSVRVPARGEDGAAPAEIVTRLARLDPPDGGGEVLSVTGGVALLASDEIDSERVAQRLAERVTKLRSEVERGERKLANERFVAKAPPEVVAEERRKLDGYRSELAELESVA
ncbi:valine--tRNA ligase [Thermoleophilia bacterium SCSIO 60948]|nr:valine--tRNA ligase [Thermoleophilia bacterium SCSIO 60948]